MKIGLISDIHAYWQDFAKAMDLLMSHKVDKILCGGDIVDGGPDGDRIVEALQRSLIPTVQGNHEVALIKTADLEGQSELCPQSLQVLRELPKTIHYDWLGKRIVLAHGTPRDQQSYVFESAVPKGLKRSLRYDPPDFLILGHTHKPMDLRLLGCRILNPGSVRKRRPRDSHSCAILELPSGRFTVYDLASRQAIVSSR